MVMAKWGLSTAVLINALVFVLAAGLLFYVSRQYEEIFTPGTAPKLEGFRFEWWYLLPGICGFALVMGIPWAIPRIGATRVFLFVVVGQMLASLVWDLLVEKKTPDFQRLVGAAMAIGGLIISSWGLSAA